MSSWGLRRMIWGIRRNSVKPVGLKRDLEYEEFKKSVQEEFSAIADELDSLKDYICKQQQEINKLRKIIEKGR